MEWSWVVKVFGLVALWVGFVVCMVAAWSHRFVPADGALRCGLHGLALAGGRPAGLSLEDGVPVMTARPDQRCSAAFLLRGADRPEFLHIRHHAIARGILVGEDEWDDGRLYIQWRVKGGLAGISRIHSARFSEDGGVQTIVIRSPRRGAVPVLVFENLGHAGTYELRRFEWVAARERNLWKFGRWGLASACLALLVATIAGGTPPSHWRGWAAAGIWLWVAVLYAFPGPWEVSRPFAIPFAFGDAMGMDPGSTARELSCGVEIDGQAAQMESLPAPRDIGLRLKLLLPWLRPLLHWVLLFVPVLAMAWLIGAKRAWWLGWGLSLSIETAQILYGFGAGWDDLFDVVVNGIAISAAVWVHRTYAKRVHRKLPFRFPEVAD